MPHHGDGAFTLSVERELDKGIAQLRRGIEAQRAAHYGETARFLVMVDLAGGLRRLLEVAFVVLPLPAQACSPGNHLQARSLVSLLDEVLAACSARSLSTSHLQRLQAFLTHDPLFRKAVGVLSEFEALRQEPHLTVPGEATPALPPEFAWGHLEQAVAVQQFPEEEERRQRLLSADPAQFTQPVQAEVARVFERFGHALFQLLAAQTGASTMRAMMGRWRQLVGMEPSWDDPRSAGTLVCPEPGD